MEEEQHRTESPQVIAGKRPAAIKDVEQEVTMNLPSGQTRCPAISAFNLNLQVRPTKSRNEYGKDVEKHLLGLASRTAESRKQTEVYTQLIGSCYWGSLSR